MKLLKRTPYLFCLLLLITACNSDEIICKLENDNPQALCDTGMLIIRSDGDTGEPRFSLDSISKPITLPLIFQNIRQNQQDDTQFDVFNRPSNYDAYNSITNEYFIGFPLQQRLYKYNINTQTRQEFIASGIYAAPVFDNGVLYAISIPPFGVATNPADYNIETINQSDGLLTNITSSSFPLLSRFDIESMSSTSDNNGIIYFISGTNLVSYNINTATANHEELVPTFNITTNFQQFFGLEMRNNGNLLVIRERNNSNGDGVELVEINISNLTATPTVIYDFMANGIELNSEFYSTTYDACDDMYYITSRNDDFVTTDFHEINLTDSTIQTENFSFYLMGIESKNN